MQNRKLRTSLATCETTDAAWWHVDAEGKVLGRLATKIATVLMGKHKPTYTPHVDTGDFIVVTNAGKVRITGRKTETMSYPRYSYYPGGFKDVPYQRFAKDHPEKVLTEAVRRMMPKNALGRNMLKKLKVYTTDTHPHAAQCPQAWTF
ncbi:MAG: 50S ribosomal protein L13 [Planctomycetes bacterium]|nr:50S ribosomal protein L13 [Planctomycetota bacterium]